MFRLEIKNIVQIFRLIIVLYIYIYRNDNDKRIIVLYILYSFY